uniref:Uncharacterized protein n=1 Tax=Anguilla anguilla TaxID=7936 RepID=A0A0E9VG88_ANGAN
MISQTPAHYTPANGKKQQPGRVALIRSVLFSADID